jgi:hypothetical protein
MEKKITVAISVLIILAIISFLAVNEFFVIFPSYDDNISFHIWETDKGMSEPKIMLNIETEKEYKCSNYYLHHNMFMKENTIIVSLSRHILPPSICATAEGPARFTEVLDIAEGEYFLELHSSKGTDIYRVMITEETINIINQTATYSKPKKTVVNRS